MAFILAIKLLLWAFGSAGIRLALAGTADELNQCMNENSQCVAETQSIQEGLSSST